MPSGARWGELMGCVCRDGVGGLPAMRFMNGNPMYATGRWKIRQRTERGEGGRAAQAGHGGHWPRTIQPPNATSSSWVVRPVRSLDGQTAIAANCCEQRADSSRFLPRRRLLIQPLAAVANPFPQLRNSPLVFDRCRYKSPPQLDLRVILAQCSKP